MKKKLFLIMVLVLLPNIVLAAPEKPPGSSGSSNSSVSYIGNTTISSSTEEEGKTYSSTTGSENALLVSGGTSTINNCTLNKTGDASGDNADFYGTNAAVLVYNGATLNIIGGTFTTNGSHANAIFSYGTGIINLNNVTINTTSNNSGGVMVTGGGTLTANNCTVKTQGNSSAAIRSDRGGGTLIVNKGTYETNGVGSPAVYSTADITVSDATLTSTASEGLVVEGSNSITIKNTKVIDTNTTLNGNSETYKNVFLYQSMSGDADEGIAKFTASDSELITNKGDTIFVTNTTASISLTNNTITNIDGDFLRIQTGKWGSSGSNGGNVTLMMDNQKVNGSIIVDSISTLDMTMNNSSVLEGTINKDNTAKNINLSLSKDSILSLTGDTYVTSLDNKDTSNSNIYSNGTYKLYVNENEVQINNSSYNGSIITSDDTTTIGTKEKSANYIYYVLGGIFLVGISVLVIIFLKKNKQRDLQ